MIKDRTPNIPKYLEQTTSLKVYKSERLAKEKVQIVNQHIKNTQTHISLGNYNLKQQWSSTAHLLDPVTSNRGEGGAGLLWWLSGKGSACSAGDTGLIPESGRSPGEGNGNPLQYSCWGNSLDRDDWRATVHGVTKESDMTSRLNNNKVQNKRRGENCEAYHFPRKEGTASQRWHACQIYSEINVTSMTTQQILVSALFYFA